MKEQDFLALLRPLASDPEARGLVDDTAVMDAGGGQLVLTHDIMAEGVHFLPEADPRDVAWKLVAVNLSDLAAKGAQPVGLLLGYSLGHEAGWDEAFVAGLKQALDAMNVPLLGGDTVGLAPGALRSFGITAIGRTDGLVPSRTGAQAGDVLWVCGTIGDAAAGLELLQAGEREPVSLIAAHSRPVPLIAQGQALAPHVSAMMDVSDGLLIDARRLADASGLAITIDLDATPVSADYRALHGDDANALLKAATGGDDYALLFTLTEGVEPAVPAVRIGRCATGRGLGLRFAGMAYPLPAHLGYEHG